MSDDTTTISALAPFHDRDLITGVLHVVKSGKEATVYCCRAHPSTGVDLLAAKVYRPFIHRTFRNDAVYQQGRVILNERSARAFKKKTSFGQEVQYGMWLEHEYQTLRDLHRAGADVPRPLARSENAILMEYVGEEEYPAPILNNVSLEPAEARRLFDQIMRNVELWLEHNYIHGDLSRFNILYWDGRLTIIDFPQAVDPRFNASAYELLQRDIANVCAYWSRYGVRADAPRLAGDLWGRFMLAQL